ncbi:relaxase, partial [uncultured Flavobacterium sp.]|uniref:relaxase n=1 Tax=uncultured Flavobacterium sp. TaxID=165435 RepID=UPI00259537FF
HIVTTNVQTDGKTIDMYLIGTRKSEPARKAIEKKFGLVTAEGKGPQQLYRPDPVNLKQIAYGKLETKKAIQNVLEHVIKQYKYTSLPELNAVLGRYNIMAQRGDENSRVYRHSGLLYRVIDPHGNPVGVPIKASLFYSKPTLKNLQEYFTKNDQARLKHKARIKNAIDLALKGNNTTIRQLENYLHGQGIDLIIRQNEMGFIYGLTYVDHKTKCVFNGSAIGKAYSAKAIQERCTVSTSEMPIPAKVKQGAVPTSGEVEKTENTVAESMTNSEFRSFVSELIDLLTQEEFVPDRLPYELSLRKRKKRRKHQLDNNN